MCWGVSGWFMGPVGTLGLTYIPGPPLKGVPGQQSGNINSFQNISELRPSPAEDLTDPPPLVPLRSRIYSRVMLQSLTPLRNKS